MKPFLKHFLPPWISVGLYPPQRQDVLCWSLFVLELDLGWEWWVHTPSVSVAWCFFSSGSRMGRTRRHVGHKALSPQILQTEIAGRSPALAPPWPRPGPAKAPAHTLCKVPGRVICFCGSSHSQLSVSKGTVDVSGSKLLRCLNTTQGWSLNSQSMKILPGTDVSGVLNYLGDIAPGNYLHLIPGQWPVVWPHGQRLGKNNIWEWVTGTFRADAGYIP